MLLNYLLGKLDNLFGYSGNQGNGYLVIENIYFKFGVYTPKAIGNNVITISSPKFKSVMYCDCRSDYYRTYPEDKPSFDYYGGSSGRIYVPKSFPIGNNIYYIIIGII